MESNDAELLTTKSIFLIEQMTVLVCVTIQSDRKENKSEQALQIVGHVVAESYSNKHGRWQFVVSNATLLLIIPYEC
jgi:uncharacterized membrane protein